MAGKKGRSGRKSTPIETLRRRGTLRPCRHGDRGVSLPAGAPEPPASLSAAARVEWDRLCPILTAAGVLTVTDRDILAAYCEVLVELAAINAFCVTKEMYRPIVKTVGGNVIQNPAIGLRNTLRTQLRSFAACLGLSPADRASIKVSGEPVPDELDKLIAAAVAARKGRHENAR